jgi:transcriptional regulator with XRE-family HTH domain
MAEPIPLHPEPRTPGERMRVARGARTQREIAEALGVKQPTVAEWEADRKSPRSDKLAQIAELLGLDVNDLLPKSRAA